jgi:uncharacterized membrane protein YfcA
MDYEAVKEFAILGLVALMIGVSKAGFGGGTGLLVGPLLVMVFPSAKESVGLMLPLLAFCDLAALYPYWRKWDTRNVLVLMPGALLGVFLGDRALDHMSDYLLRKTIGGFAVAFALLQIYRDWILRREKPLIPGWRLGSLVGVGTGFVSTLSHVGGTLTTMYLIPQRLESDRFVGTTTVIYLLVNLAKIPVFIHHDMLTSDMLAKDFPLFPLALLGTALGVYLNRRVPGKWFSRVVLVIVLVTGVHLLIKD